MEHIFNVDIVIILLKIVFILAGLVQVYFYLRYYLQVALYKKRGGSENLPAVSVIIAARNEADNLLENLPFVLNQDYPNFEVVVVNDGSQDETQRVLEKFQEEHKQLKIVMRPHNEIHDAGKKLAITLGVKGATNERLLFTDADCKPVSKNWIRSMMGVDEGQNLILGYSPYYRKKGFVNKIIRVDNFFTAMNYLGFALSGNPYMGVGRNLSYTKTKFFEVGGFKKHYSIASGDDDLFVNEVATKENTRVCIDKDAVVESIPKADWSSFWHQKRRHMYTGRRYKPIHKILLVLQPVSYLAFIISGILLLVFNNWMYIVLIAIGVRMLLQLLIFRQSSRWLGQADVLIFIPLLEPFIVLMTGFIHLANASAKPSKWKN